jgi:hypothetical protein
MAKKKIDWFARGGGIAKCGPFGSQAEATAAMRQVTETDQQYARLVAMYGPIRTQYNGGFPEDVFVWPEAV